MQVPTVQGVDLEFTGRATMFLNVVEPTTPIILMRKRNNMEEYDWTKPYETGGYYIPQRMMYGIKHYVLHGQKPGDFLQAVISNDLKMAVSYADDENLRNISAYVRFFYNEMPSNCWGNPKIMADWIKGQGFVGKYPKKDK